jgi:putative transcriptional regulator
VLTRRALSPAGHSRSAEGQDGAVEVQGTLRGRLLVASPSLTAPPFLRTVIAVLDHNRDGALGVVLNRPGEAPLGEVVPAVASLGTEPAVVYVGGPVEPSAAIALGLVEPTQRGPAGDAWRPVSPPLVTVDLDADPDLLAASITRLRVFAGYAGWSAGQLESEIASGAWYVVDAFDLDAFDPRPDRLWRAVLRRQPWPLSAVAVAPLDPRLN